MDSKVQRLPMALDENFALFSNTLCYFYLVLIYLKSQEPEFCLYLPWWGHILGHLDFPFFFWLLGFKHLLMP